jgi:hypothetical protein
VSGASMKRLGMDGPWANDTVSKSELMETSCRSYT